MLQTYQLQVLSSTTMCCLHTMMLFRPRRPPSTAMLPTVTHTTQNSNTLCALVALRQISAICRPTHRRSLHVPAVIRVRHRVRERRRFRVQGWRRGAGGASAAAALCRPARSAVAAAAPAPPQHLLTRDRVCESVSRVEGRWTLRMARDTCSDAQVQGYLYRTLVPSERGTKGT